MKKIANLNGAKALNKNEMKAINGGRISCSSCKFCPPGYLCTQPNDPCGYNQGYCVPGIIEP